MTSSQSKIFEEIENAYNDKRRVKKWLAVADRYLKSYGNDIFERHWEGKDIVMELITLLLEDERHYNPDKYKNFDQFVYSSIQSITEGKLKSRQRVLPQKTKVQARHGEQEIDLIEINNKSDKDYILNDIERTEKLEKCYNRLLEDDDCTLVFLEWKEGNSSKDIAHSLGIAVEEVERIKKRIRYNLNKNINHN